MSDYIMSGQALAEKCVDVARNFQTIYMYACYGFQVTTATIKSKAQQNLNGWYTKKNIAKLEAVANRHPPVWGFDCVNLIKGLLWGWWGNEEKEKGGAIYASNGIPDTNADGMIKRCGGVTTDFSDVQIGEAVWMSGHIGVYIGDGLAVECTPRWKDGVQVTAVWNIGKKDGYNGRTWTSHGKLPHVDYGDTNITIEDGTPAYALGYRLLKRGCIGEDVKELQTALNKLGCECGEVDGEFGRQTENAVKLFQERNGLKVDGKFGPATLAKLKEALDENDTGEIKEPTYTITIHGVNEADMLALKERWADCECQPE